MSEIQWSEKGASVEVVKAIRKEISFTVVTEGRVAKALQEIFGVQTHGITSAHAPLLVGMAVILAVAGLVLFALANGYKVNGKARGSDGSEYEINFEPQGKI